MNESLCRSSLRRKSGKDEKGARKGFAKFSTLLGPVYTMLLASSDLVELRYVEGEAYVLILFYHFSLFLVLRSYTRMYL